MTVDLPNGELWTGGANQINQPDVLVYARTASGTTPPLTTLLLGAVYDVAIDADAANENFLIIAAGGEITITNRQFGVLVTSDVNGTPRGGCFGQ